MTAARFTSAGSKEILMAGTGTEGREPRANSTTAPTPGTPNTWATYKVPLSSPLGLHPATTE